MDRSQPLALVIDDEDDIRETEMIALKTHGWRVKGARDGREALATMEEEVPSLLIVDLMMPGMSGIEFCHKMIQKFKTRDVSVLMISAVSERAKILEDFWALPVRAKDFLRKPFEVESLLRCVDAIVPEHLRKSLSSQAPAAPKPQKPASTSGPRQATLSPAGGARETTLKPSAPTAPSAPAQPKPAAPQDATGYKVLIIDDDPDIITMLRLSLSMRHEVITAENGMQALALVTEHAPDFIISDINMPVMNGIETAQAVRALPSPLRAIPIFFLTGETDKDLPKLSYDVGGNLFLRKPIDPMKLMDYLDYFFKETGLKPGQHGVKAGQKPQADAKASAPAAAPKQPLRVVVVDYNVENHQIMRQMFGDGQGEEGRLPGGPYDVIYCTKHTEVLANLARWEPDLILYNPRNPGLDGVGFGQKLLLQKQRDLQELAFIGTLLYPADENYSKTQLGRSAINLSLDPGNIATALAEAVEDARKHQGGKQLTLAQIHEQEDAFKKKVQAESAKQARTREVYKQKYAGIQEFINKNF